jgi:hypothetical protein
MLGAARLGMKSEVELGLFFRRWIKGLERVKPLPIGMDDFKKVMEKECYYVDKTLMIKELLDLSGEVNLFTRPRRFGKTLNLSMLKYFFEDTGNSEKNEENKRLFDGLNIMGTGEEYTKHMCNCPVISITLKSAQQDNFQFAYDQIVNEISGEFGRHRNLLESILLSENEKQTFKKIMAKEAGYSDYAGALKFLSECLYEHTGKKSIILIDEYDVPLAASYSGGFYNEMISFIRSLFGSALKTNLTLDFAVVTGCLRISKESIFTGLNNLNVISICNMQYSEHFGFLEKEVKEMLAYYGRSSRFDDVKDWYDGYCFGNSDIYNPWSVIKFVSSVVSKENARPEPYWANTSSNSIVKEVLVETDETAKEQVQKLINGETILIQVREEVTYGDLEQKNGDQQNDNFWNFLFLTGYLTKVRELSEEEIENGRELYGKTLDIDQRYLLVRIPNREVRSIYKNMIREWFEEISVNSKKELYLAVKKKDVEGMNLALDELLANTISVYDSAEAFYHGFMIGIFGDWADYKMTSNRESGTGRADLIFKPKRLSDPAIIMEFKRVKKKKEVLPACEAALRQIEENRYDYELVDDGYDVIRYGICFCGKSCIVIAQ